MHGHPIGDENNSNRISTLFTKALRAIKYIRESGIIHRDIKPDNLFICDRDDVKVLDFGLSKSFVFTEKTNNSDEVFEGESHLN